MITILPPLAPSGRVREFNNYNDSVRSIIVYNWLTGNMSDRAMNDAFIPNAGPKDNGRIAMNIRLYLGLTSAHKDFFRSKTDYEILRSLETASINNPDYALPYYYFKNQYVKIHEHLEDSLYSQELEKYFPESEIKGKNFIINTLLKDVKSSSDKIDRLLLNLPDIEERDANTAKTISINKNITVFVRSCDVRESIKSLYDYHCQVCGNVILKTGWEASQERKESWKYLSADLHHIHPLSKGGPDIQANAVCLCPTCHRKFHSGEFRLKQDGNKIACIDEMLGHKQFIKLKHQIDLGL